MKNLILFTFMLLLLTGLVFAGPNDPTRFGNLTDDTVWIGGSEGIGNFTGWVETHDEFKGNLNASYIQDPIWIETADEGNLNVNSSTFWASVSSFISKWFYDDGNILSFNVTELNKTIDARSDFDSKWSVDGIWIYNNSGDLSFNTTSGDSRYYTQTAADLQFIAQADEADLNVNSSNYWDLLNTPGDILISDLNPSGEEDLNVNASDYWDSETSQADLNVNQSSYWDLLNTPADIAISDLDQSGEADLNVNASDYWDELGSPSDIAISDLDQSGEEDLNVNSSTFWASVSSFQAKWFADVANVFTFDEIELNATIDARSTNETGTVTSVATGAGLSGGPITTTGTIVTDAVTAGATEYSYWNGSAWLTREDDNITYTNGTGITLTGTTFAFDQTYGDGRYYLDSNPDSYDSGSSNLTLSDIATGLGNWSADKGDYYTITQVDASQTVQNTTITNEINARISIGNWSEDKPNYVNQTYANATYYLDSNPDSFSSTTGTVTSVATDDTYLTGGAITTTGTITFNETKLNETIEALDNDTKYTADEIYINLVGTEFSQDETKLNATIDDRDTDTTYDNGTGLVLTGTTFSFDQTYGDGRYYLDSNPDGFASGSSNLTLSDITTSIGNWSLDKPNYVNETYANDTYYLDSNPDSFSSTVGTVTSVATDDIYLTGGAITSTGTISLDETKLNATIEALDNDTKYTADEIYINLIGTEFSQDETKLNATIDDRDTDTTYTASGTLLDLSTTTFSVNAGTLTTGKGCKFVTGSGIVCDQDYSTTVGTITSVTGTSPIVSSGGTTPAISATIAKDLITTAPLTGSEDNIFLGADSDLTIAMPVATAIADGYLDKDDWTIFNNKADSDTTYDNGTGLVLTGTTFSFDQTYGDGRYYLDSNPDGFASGTSNLTLGDITSSIGNWSEDKPKYVNQTYGNATYILTSTEADLNVNSSDYWDGLGSPSDINAADITADGTYRLQSWNNLTGIPHATPSNSDVTHFSLADEIYDWVIGLGYSTTVGTVTSIATTAPLTGGAITTTGTISLTACDNAEGYVYNSTSAAFECTALGSGSGTVTSVATDDTYLTGGPITGSGTVTFSTALAGTDLAVNSSDYWDGLGSPSDINAADITDDGTYYLDSNPDKFINQTYGNATYYLDSNPDSYDSGSSNLTLSDVSTYGNATYYLDSNPDKFIDQTYGNVTYRLQSWNNLTGIPHATPADADTTHFSLDDEIYDWVIGLGYSTTVGTVTSVTGASPIVSSGGVTPEISATIAKDLVTTAPMTGAVDNVFLGTDSDVTIGITVAKDLVTTAPLTGATDNIFTGSDADITIAITMEGDLVATSPITGSANDIFPGTGTKATIAATILKDLVATAPLTGSVDDVLLGTDSDLTIGINVLKDLVTTAPLTGAADDVFTGTDADITLAIQMEGDLVTTAPLTGAAANIFPGTGTKATIAMPVATTSASGYLSTTDWNTFNNKAASDTTYSAGNGISESSEVFTVAGGTALTQDAGGLSVTAGGIGDTQIADAYINQALTTTSDVTFNNATITDCIIFASGGTMCSYP